MELQLTRHWFFEGNTIGLLYVDGAAECFMLEDCVREVPDQPVAVWKVDKQTAIPQGRYRVLWTLSDRFKRKTLQIMDVPGFTGIRIHAGNTAEDTEGCPLTGRVGDLDGAVYKSGAALKLLEAKVLPVLEAGTEVWIAVTNLKK